MQWQDTKLHAHGGCCPAAVAGYLTACARGCPAVAASSQTASLSNSNSNSNSNSKSNSNNSNSKMYRVSHNTWDFKNALGRPLNDNVESWEVSHFEAKDHIFQTPKWF
jgi:hypothetical protein